MNHRPLQAVLAAGYQQHTHARPQTAPTGVVSSFQSLKLENVIETRVVSLIGGIDEQSVGPVIQQLRYLDRSAPGEPILLEVSSDGGDVYAGTALIDVMKALKSPVMTLALGQSLSMGAIIVANGEPGARYAAPNARIMIHQPSRTVKSEKTSAGEAFANAQQLQRTYDLLTRLLVEATGKSEPEIRGLLEEDTFLSPAEAVQLNLVDVVGLPV